LEDPRPLNSEHRYQELLALIKSKADRDASQRWSASLQQLKAEMQAVHVHTQTLGQDMKVVLSWMDGMADKVSDVHGVASSVMLKINATRSEVARSREIAAASAQVSTRAARHHLAMGHAVYLCSYVHACAQLVLNCCKCTRRGASIRSTLTPVRRLEPLAMSRRLNHHVHALSPQAAAGHIKALLAAQAGTKLLPTDGSLHGG
jgi:hypothetical protein